MKIALLGYGKMGKAIEQVALDGGNEIALKIDRNNRSQLTVNELSKVDVAIDFSEPESAVDNILLCFDAGVPVVVGTTGWYNRFDEVKAACEDKDGTLFYATNFSVGVNIFFKLSELLAKMMDAQQDYEVSVHEVHHTEKKDAPSGTAITLAKGLLDRLERKQQWVNTRSEQPEDLQVLSYREKDVPGIHIVNYESDIDSIEIKHTAYSRQGFARGAVSAAKWVAGRKGCYQMRDMLNFGL